MVTLGENRILSITQERNQIGFVFLMKFIILEINRFVFLEQIHLLFQTVAEVEVDVAPDGDGKGPTSRRVHRTKEKAVAARAKVKEEDVSIAAARSTTPPTAQDLESRQANGRASTVAKQATERPTALPKRRI